jgi:hypothetical protein
VWKAAAAAESINAAAGGRRGRDEGGTGRERGEDCLPASLSWPVVPAWVLWHPHAVIQPHCVQPAVMVKKKLHFARWGLPTREIQYCTTQVCKARQGKDAQGA